MPGKHKRYKVRVILQESNSFFKPPLLGKTNITKRAAFWVSRNTFRYLVLKSMFKLYVGLLVVCAGIMFILALISQMLGVTNFTAINYAYMFLLLLMMPFFTYFIDVYQAMQLRLGMNLAVRGKSYPKAKEGQQEQTNKGKFEWAPTNLAILNKIIRDSGKIMSYGDFGKIANVDRQTAAGAIRKMISSKIIYENGGTYYFSGIDFEVLVGKGRKLKHRRLSREEKERLRYLFEIMCFVAF